MKNVKFSKLTMIKHIFKNSLNSLLLVSFLFISFENSGKSNCNFPNRNFDIVKNSSLQGKFVLTHLLGKKLKVDAHFILTSDTQWTLDLRNGDKIKYNVISYNQSNQLCGIKCVDSNGDKCEICISKQLGNETIITFKYNKGTLTYKGYYV